MYAAYTHGKASRIDDEFLWCKDGTGLPVEYGATPILKDGAIVGAVISFTDITERKRTSRPGGQRAKTRRILATSNEGFWLIDNNATDPGSQRCHVPDPWAGTGGDRRPQHLRLHGRGEHPHLQGEHRAEGERRIRRV